MRICSFSPTIRHRSYAGKTVSLEEVQKKITPEQKWSFYFDQQSPLEAGWRKRTENFISSFFASGHCASDRQLCFTSSRQFCRNSKCSHEIPACLYEKPQPLSSAGPDPAQDQPNAGCAAGILAEGMAKLSMDMPWQRKPGEKTEMLNPFMFNLDSSKYNVASSPRSKPSEQNDLGRDRALHTAMMPMADGGLLNLSVGGMMSDAALQSHVCEFCQAVFPRDSTTRGEYLRHLCTHVA
ncbi:uncharacterized protein zgc:113184 isoform X1 [Fundulus heteroclitus]|uniref:uncharacterized protein zgc:113184 isoform X1 n=1 Tax=Fundulus heteroclitus TaxID=8078 RepID=UPI00165CC89A|nr:uncharacterized protein zgc:113184 isoform X1 [Fundulus heteroclitus]